MFVVEDGHNTLFGCRRHQDEVVPNSGYHHDIDPNMDLVSVIAGKKALQHAFCIVQQSSPGSENLAERNEMHVVLHTVFEVGDGCVVEVVA